MPLARLCVLARLIADKNLGEEEAVRMLIKYLNKILRTRGPHCLGRLHCRRSHAPGVQQLLISSSKPHVAHNIVAVDFKRRAAIQLSFPSRF